MCLAALFFYDSAVNIHGRPTISYQAEPQTFFFAPTHQTTRSAPATVHSGSSLHVYINKRPSVTEHLTTIGAEAAQAPIWQENLLTNENSCQLWQENFFATHFSCQLMGRSSFADSLLTRVRRYFGISQDELARYLGISASQLSRLEGGQRAFSAEVVGLVEALEQQLPPAGAPLLAPGAADLGTPAPAPLEARLDYCQHHARRLRRELRPLEAQAAYAARWRVALPALRATLPPDPGGEEPPVHTGPGRWAAFLVWYRWRWLEQRPTTLSPAESARYHLLRLQAEALKTEATALQRLLQGE